MAARRRDGGEEPEDSSGGRAVGSPARLARLSLLIASIVLTLAFVELLLRLTLEPDPEPAVPAAISAYHAELGWVNRPNAVATSGRTGVPIEYRINSRGCRDRETRVEKRAGFRRIVALGDSYTFGSGVQIEQHFTRLLEGYLPALEVINLGVQGYGVDQSLLMLRRNGLAYRPDIVLLFVPHYGRSRHMKTTLWGMSKPRFALRGDTLVLQGSPVPERKVARIGSWLERRSRVAALGARGVRDLLGVGEEHQREEPVDAGESEEDLHELGAAIIAQIAAESERAGAAFALVTLVPEIHRRAAFRGLPSLLLTNCLDNPLFELPDGLGHLNEAGNGVLAWRVATYLVDEGLVPRPRRWKASTTVPEPRG